MDTDERIQNETSAKIAELNDAFRKQNPVQYMITPGIFNTLNLPEVIEEVRSFNDFNEDNDPYGEHDFGSFELDGQKVFWKLSCYDDPEQGINQLDPRCERVLTVMLAEEF